MATRLYLPASVAATPISPTPDAGWEDSSNFGRAVCRKTSISDAMTTVGFSDASNADRDCLVRQFISPALNAGQIITGAQSIKLQAAVSESTANNNVFLTVGVRVIAGDGSTVRKTVLAVTRDNLEVRAEASGGLQNRRFTATSAAGNYTTQAGDRLVVEVGLGGDPSGSNTHSGSIRLGDAAATDLAEDDTTTADNRPWVEFADTLIFIDTGVANLNVRGATLAASASFVTPTFTGSSALGIGSIVISAVGAFSVTFSGSSSLLTGEVVLTGSGAFASPPRAIGKISQPRYGLSGRRFTSFVKRGTYTGSGGFVTGPITTVATATFQKPTWTGTANLSVASVDFVSVGASTQPSFTGVAGLLIGGTSLSGTSTFVRPTYTGTISVSAPPVLISASGTFQKPARTGSAALNVGGVTLASVADLPRTVGKITQPRFSVSGRRYGSFVGRVQQFAATASLQVGGISVAGSGTSVQPIFGAVATLQCGGAQFSGFATFQSPESNSASVLLSGISFFASGYTVQPGGRFIGKITQFQYGLTGRRYGSFAGKLRFGGVSVLQTAPVVMTADAVFAPPPYTGIADLATGGVGLTAIASSLQPEFEGSANLTTAPVTLFAVAEFVVPVHAATAQLSAGPISLSGNATFTPVFVATADLTLTGAQFSATAEFQRPIYAASADFVAPAVTMSAFSGFRLHRLSLYWLTYGDLACSKM